MDNTSTNELIEQYLSGALPAAEQQALETRMSTDAAFRDEVELHRQLHEEFADTQKLHLRDLMRDIVQETPPPPSIPKSGPWKGLGIALVVLLAGWLGWLWLSPAREGATVPAQQQETKSAPSQPMALPDTSNTSSEPVEKAPERPIAMADPAAFKPNRMFEDRLSSNIRASGGAAELQSPAKGSNYSPENGVVKINFMGTAPADGDTAQYPLTVKLYPSQSGSTEPLVQFAPRISNRGKTVEKWTFSSAQRLRLRPGLYYFTVERLSDEDIIFVGKFTVGSPK